LKGYANPRCACFVQGFVKGLGVLAVHEYVEFEALMVGDEGAGAQPRGGEGGDPECASRQRNPWTESDSWSCELRGLPTIAADPAPWSPVPLGKAAAPTSFSRWR